ncbi:hypothetical protein UPYG_G00288980 [Umbra pygmaea]|uniref:Uncharacterized protein n=1 Tax=Umbra pygmaea TaxID=75934 RepID=A0ABD0W4F3_UMBPY
MNMQVLLEELKEKNLISEELKDKQNATPDLPVHLLSRQAVEYTKAQRDFAPTAPSAWSKGISLPKRDPAYSPATSQFIAKVAELS